MMDKYLRVVANHKKSYTYTSGGFCDIIVIIVRIEHGDTSSNNGRGCFYFTYD